MEADNPEQPILGLKGITKYFKQEVAVDDVDLDVRRGEFLTLLGPSGCGKSTILRMVAGFEQPTSGEILMDGMPITHARPYNRNVGLVFQNLALFPHLSVSENIAFGLRIGRRGRRDVSRHVDDMLAVVGLEGFKERRIHQLSGGQRQRVALARSLVTQPSVLLLDEPLSALDLKLRRQLQEELKRIQRLTGTTFIFVTHDQEEALSMSDRVAVMNGGKIEQLGSSVDIYHFPRTRFVAHFVGETNLFKGRILAIEGAHARIAIERPEATMDIPLFSNSLRPGDDAYVSVRPECIELQADAEVLPLQTRGVVAEVIFSGASVICTLDVEGLLVRALLPYRPNHRPIEVGQAFTLGWASESARVVPA